MRKWLKNKRWFFITGVLIIINIAGCKKLVQVDEPDDSFTSAMVFSNDSLAQTAVTGLYIKIMTYTKYLLSGGMSVFTSLSGDELQRTSSMLNEEQFYQNDINPNNQLINTNIWKAAYTYIYHCNSCIEGLHKSNGVSKILKDRLTGEVKFMRALCYYYLVNLYGDVPLALGTNADVNAMLSRAPVAKVYKQIEMDLVEASDALINERIKTAPTIFAAQALLARVYLHLKEWDKAEQMANAVINSGQFVLQNNLSEVFLKDSKETIFQLAPVQSGMNSPEGFVFVVIGGKPAYSISTALWDAFEVGDQRKDSWIKSVTIAGQTYRYPNKYKVYKSAPGSEITEYNVVLRLAEQYLIRAEALARLSRIEDAVNDINAIRTRAGLIALEKNINDEQCLDAIFRERRIEFFTEWGHRWIDLKRTDRANAVLKVKSNWQYYDTLYPIPLSELETAPNLEQNPGYE
ncbi:MAG TPA: RagB/SusD family nutrient uptake outer membrane protein [Niastella sp.]